MAESSAPGFHEEKVMHIFLFKSIMSLFVLLSAAIALYTMFEIFWRREKKYRVDTMKILHRINGRFYLLLIIIIAYFCLDFILKTRAVPSLRGLIHAVIAATVFVLLFIKILLIRSYPRYYSKAKTLGIIIAIMTFVMIGTSGGYYFFVTNFGTDITTAATLDLKKDAAPKSVTMTVRTDHFSISKGRVLYESKCYFCHDAYSAHAGVGPGHKGILKNSFLPVSKKPANPENVINQIKNPYMDMPSFSYLSSEEIQDLLAFLNTL